MALSKSCDVCGHYFPVGLLLAVRLANMCASSSDSYKVQCVGVQKMLSEDRRNYGPDDVTEGKAAAKAELRRRFGLSTEVRHCLTCPGLCLATAKSQSCPSSLRSTFQSLCCRRVRVIFAL